jgi:ATP-binding protein involved in chromosome partitioning
MPTEKDILQALSGVQEPELHKDLVTLGMIKELEVQAGKVNFTIELTTPACPLKDQIQRDAEQAVLAVDGVTDVKVSFSSNVPNDGRSRGLIKRPIRNAIAVASGKGGVGKTTIAVNTSVALAQAGARVGLLDADIYGPNVPIMMGVHQLPPPEGDRMIPAEAYGVKLISMAFLVKPEQPLIWRGPMLHSAIRQFIAEVEWGELDYLIIDLPPGTGDAPLSVSQSLPLSGAVIVTLPQQVSLDDARRGLEMFRTMKVPILGIVENMSYLELADGTKMDVFGEGGGEKLAKETSVPFFGAVPMDPNVRQGSDAGVPVIIAHPELKVAASLRSVAEAIAAKVSVNAYQQSNIISVEMID